MRKMSVGWTNVLSSGTLKQVAKKGDMAIVSDNCMNFTDAEQYWQWVSSGQFSISVLFFRPQYPRSKDPSLLRWRKSSKVRPELR